MAALEGLKAIHHGYVGGASMEHCVVIKAENSYGEWNSSWRPCRRLRVFCAPEWHTASRPAVTAELGVYGLAAFQKGLQWAELRGQGTLSSFQVRSHCANTEATRLPAVDTGNTWTCYFRNVNAISTAPDSRRLHRKCSSQQAFRLLPVPAQRFLGELEITIILSFEVFYVLYQFWCVDFKYDIRMDETRAMYKQCPLVLINLSKLMARKARLMKTMVITALSHRYQTWMFCKFLEGK